MGPVTNYRESCACASRVTRHVSRTRQNKAQIMLITLTNNIQTRTRLRLLCDLQKLTVLYRYTRSGMLKTGGAGRFIITRKIKVVNMK